MSMTTHRMKKAFQEQGPSSRMAASIHLLWGLDQHLPYLAARTFKGLTLTYRDDGWLLVLKADRKGRPQVAFFGGDNPEECIHEMASSLIFDLVRWQPDKFRSIRNDKK